MLKCIKCEKENIYSAEYCQDCGYHFSEIEQKTAKKKTVIGKLEYLEDTYNKWTLKKLLDKTWIKVLSFIILIVIDVFMFYGDNKDVRLLESEKYEIQYDQKADIHYLLIEEDSVGVDLYAPKRLEKLEIKKQNKNKEVLESFEYNPEEELILEANSRNDYYLFDITYSGNKTEEMKIYVFKEV